MYRPGKEKRHHNAVCPTFIKQERNRSTGLPGGMHKSRMSGQLSLLTELQLYCVEKLDTIDKKDLIKIGGLNMIDLENTVLSTVFDLDNLVKYKACCELNYPAVTSEYDVVYSQKNPGVEVCDLHYIPDSQKWDKYPVILNIHGGGWIIGDKRNSTGMAFQFADNGAFVVNMNYGLPKKAVKGFEYNDPDISHAGDYHWPYPLENAFDALQWIKDNAETYNLDLNNVFVSGDSAGGHLACAVETAVANPDYRKEIGLPEPPIQLKGAMLYCGFYDVDHFFKFNMNKFPVARCMMRAFTGKKDPTGDPLYHTINPIPYFTKDMPHTLIVSGDMDMMTYGQSDKVEERMNELGIPNEHYRGTGPLSLHDYQILAFTNGSYKCMKYSAEWFDSAVG